MTGLFYLEDMTKELVKTEGRVREITQRIEEIRRELAKADKDTFASKEHVNKLMSDLKALEEELKRLRVAVVVAEREGERLKEFKGGGDRQAADAHRKAPLQASFHVSRWPLRWR